MSNEQLDTNKEMLQALREWAKKYGARILAIDDGEIQITRIGAVGYYPYWLCFCIDEDTSFERVDLEGE